MIEFSGAESALFVGRTEKYIASHPRNPLMYGYSSRREQKKLPIKNGARFDRLFLKRLWMIIGVLFSKNTQPKRFCSRAGFHGLMLCVLVVVQALTSSLTGDIIGGFYTAMSDTDLKLFWSVFWRACLVMLASAILDAAIKFLTQLLALLWRRTLVTTMQEAYFDNSVYYQLNALDTRVDNPDMRLTQDIDNFTVTLAATVQQCASGPVVIVIYTWLCVTSIAWYAPLIVFGFFLVGFFVNRALSNPIASLVFVQERLEGDFRFIHTWVRNLAEAIALSGGRSREEQLAHSSFSRLYRNKLRIIRWQGALSLSSNAFTYFGSLVNYCVVALAVFVSHAEHSVSAVSADCFYCIMLVSGWSVFFNSSKLLSDLAGYTARLGHMLEVSKDITRKQRLQVERHEKKNRTFKQEHHTQELSEAIVAQQLTVSTPDNRVLFKDLSFVIELNHNFLVTGPSGCGKSTLLKVLHGIWPYYEGTLHVPTFAPTQIQYLPQKPYICHHMSLCEQITYPFLHVCLPRQELQSMLALLDLQHLLEDDRNHDRDDDADDFKYFGEQNEQEREWYSSLSLGEQQRLCFLRVLYHRPRFAVLDESTSALDADMEERCYRLLINAGITLISVGHRDSIRKFHDVELHFYYDSSTSSDASDKQLLYSLTKIPQEVFPEQ